jgi:IBR domain, a half RING-finger domain
VSLPADFSLACITGLPPGTTPAAAVEVLRALGFDLNVNCIRIPGHAALSETKATVKVEDPLFASKLRTRLKEQKSTLSATPMPIDTKGTNCRKVYISWHKATRSAWVNFGNGDIANRVAQKFNESIYKCLGQSVRSSIARRSPSRGSRRGSSYNPVAWTIMLSDVPSDATSKDIERAITSLHDKPRHVELGLVSYRGTEAEVSVEVRLHLEKHGPLENFYLAPMLKGKRVKATAWFQDEDDARSACSLNNRLLGILGGGKLTVTLVQSAKIKISTTVYVVSKSRIDKVSKIWKEQHLVFRVYQDTLHQYTTLKVEGNNAKDLADARRTLEEILNGVVLTDGENAVWDTALSSNGGAYMKLKSIAEELHVVIIRDKSMRQLRFFGPPEKFQQVVRQITDMLREESSSSYEIDLQSHQFSWTIHGGFKSIEQALGKNVAIFNVVSRKITINGTQQQYETALAIMDGRHAVPIHSLSDDPPRVEGDCPICFCEADNPIKTSCKHTYCLECFEECCRSAASTSKDEFQIRCQGDEGTCSTVFTLREVKDHISSLVFETVLKSTFEEYIQRHPQALRYCPTPDCGYVYRCTTTSSSRPPAYTCPKCFEPLCTSCHSRHGGYTCAEYKDIASGGYDALAKLKRELNIKDCPKCTTPMEKTEGCNHMTCAGCKAHICWVCMAVFNTGGPCYEHMTKVHGGIGLGLERL